jgi:hypothetical protein
MPTSETRCSKSEHPLGPRQTVPLDIVTLDKLEEQEEERRKQWARQTADVPGVNPEVTESLGIKSGDDIPTIHRAIKSRWKIPDEAREKVGAIMAEIAMDARNPRDAVNAAKVLATLDRLNQDDEKRSDVKTTVVMTITPETVKSLSDDDLRRRLEALEAGSQG